MPFTKCEIDANPSKLSTIDDIWVKKKNSLAIPGLEYRCNNDWNKADHEPPDA